MTTIQERLQAIADTNSNTYEDENFMLAVLHKLGYNQVVISCGIVCLNGYGNPLSIQQTANLILNICKKKEVIK